MSSVITGRTDGATIPVTWAALAGLVQVLCLFIPGLLKAGALDTRMSTIETGGSAALSRHVAEHNAQYTQIIERLARIETKLERK